MLIHNINLTCRRKSACCSQLLIFRETCVIAPFCHWKSQVFPKGYCHHDLKAFCESGHNNLLKKYFRRYEVKMARILFKFIIYPSFERALKHGMVKLKIFRKSSMNFSFGQGSYLISEFSRPKSIKAVLLRISLRFDFFAILFARFSEAVDDIFL